MAATLSLSRMTRDCTNVFISNMVTRPNMNPAMSNDTRKWNRLTFPCCIIFLGMTARRIRSSFP